MTISKLTTNAKRVEIYCYGIFLRIDSKISRLFVTDFTANRQLVGEHTVENDFDRKILPKDMLLQITIWPPELRKLQHEFRQYMGEDLVDSGADTNEFYIKEKICFLRVTIDTKLYRGVMDAKANKVEVLEKENCREARELYRRFYEFVPKSFSENLSHVIERRIPLDCMPENPFPETYPNQVKRESSSEEVPPSLVKEEEPDSHDDDIYSDGIIPDTQHPEDYHSAGEDALASMGHNGHCSSISGNLSAHAAASAAAIASFQSFQTPPSLKSSMGADSQHSLGSVHRTRPVSTQSQDSASYGQSSTTRNFAKSPRSSPSPPLTSSDSQETHSISQVLSSGNDVDNRLYRVRAYIAGTIPADLSQVCVKNYTYDTILERPVLEDPFLRQLEIILSDNTNPRTVLTEKNSLVLTLNEEELLSFFDKEFKEEIYTTVATANQSFRDYLSNNPQKLLTINVKKRDAVHSQLPPVWTIHDLKLDDII
ncbi:hypothetical protein CAAN1_04S00518 [[Candida] anglica]|uniref:Telomere replication protein EST3 n=1 Tax=[Candida] anglica TaxID=148631 RepID=A0ABP0E986_9ASCO